ncbi:MAG: hypothetical protein QOD06_261 [Candidatus Binatota bacterium]|nr:hypothetical protein [Candidatus Binatota bacterium]
MPNARDDLFAHAPLADQPDWFDRFYMNVHSSGGGPTLSLGMGTYAQPGVVDGFSVLVDGTTQRNFRVSREGGWSESRLEAGPLSAEVAEPLRRWRARLGENASGFSYDIEFDGDLAPIDPGRMHRVSRRTGAVLDMTHLVQVGRVSGRIVVDGVARELSPDAWFGIRDRSWGLRPGAGNEPPKEPPHPTLGWHDWVLGRIGDHAVFYMLAGGGSRGPHLLGAGLATRTGEEKVVSVERRLEWDDRDRFRGVVAKLATEDGQSVELRASVPSATIYLRGGGYGGWKGFAHGKPRGGLVTESDRWQTTEPALVAEVAGLNDHLVRFDSDLGSGFGIYEVASGI